MANKLGARKVHNGWAPGDGPIGDPRPDPILPPSGPSWTEVRTGESRS